MDIVDSLLEEIVEDYLGRLRGDDVPSIDEYCNKHPHRALEIRELLDSIQLMERFSGREANLREQTNIERKSQKNRLQHIGDFDIVREIGRGGMGVVYEAVDRTLQRRVALKVLHDSALTTPRHIDRFHRESQLAAQLHHTNIVSVFGVGEAQLSYLIHTVRVSVAILLKIISQPK